jgi:hypothetical protein
MPCNCSDTIGVFTVKVVIDPPGAPPNPNNDTTIISDQNLVFNKDGSYSSISSSSSGGTFSPDVQTNGGAWPIEDVTVGMSINPEVITIVS